MVEVINLRNCRNWGMIGDMKIDRSSKWGNPFPMRNESERDLVCDKYEKYIDMMLQDGHLNLDELMNAKRLGCWCKEKRCHGDYLKKLLDERL